MSTSETDHYKVQKCPCGQGHVVKTIITQDNPWSSADISFSIDCAQCRNDWTIENNNLISTASALPFKKSSLAVNSSRQKLQQLTDPLVDEHFRKFGAKSMKAELRELERLGMSNSSYDSFRSAKKSGKKIYEICSPILNHDWLEGESKSNGVGDKFDELCSQLNEAKCQRDLDCKQIIKVAIQEKS